MRLQSVLLAAALLLLYGCGGNFGCKGYPEGVQCKSAREVYELTNYRDSLEKPKDAQNNGDCPECEMQQNLPVTLAGYNSPGNSPGSPPAGTAVQGLGYAGPMPLRSAAQIMRIYVAPWEAADGALHLPTYMYVEVVERRWSIGERKMEIAPQITPLEDTAIITAPSKGRKPQARPQKPVPQKGPEQSLFGPQNPKNAKNNAFFDRKTGQVRRDNIQNYLESEQ